jgi:HPt (histidine-containing phosphotransfer) domain-containing protein
MKTMAAAKGEALPVSPIADSDSCPIDHAYLSRFTLGNAKLEHEVLALFAASAPLYVQNLKTAENGRAWYEAAHTLKGSARSVGARNVALMAERAEAIKGPGEPQCAATIEALSAAVDDVRGYIAGLIAAG